ncbi:indole-3-glycerol phosphate synthase TrpC [uncultured Bacteroides sp.]|uniref:indole-3-glycerol phosphate synthase TrpC n=1 Tax=uncultured Bacteroides sp. TaxID=162156 RepID=UPI00263276EC|nr:indole-3-glycerol phosphate synthase TrpC [uncultured Bacteroides sp.]
MKEDILTQITANKRKEISRQTEAVSMKLLEAIIAMRETREPLSLSRSVMSSPTGIISEFKRRSPSKGWINREADVRLITGGYAEAGAAGLSVLTDTDFFGGSEGDLLKARLSAPSTPILRKDFIISEYQILQSVAIQANAILLIAAALEKDECRRLAEMAHSLGLEVLLEVHSEEELEYATDCIDLIGVNNRNLGSFHTDVENSFRLAEKLPKGIPHISESGISGADTIAALRHAGYNGFLMGESFMKTENPAIALRTLIEDLEKARKQ